ncbi:MAG TPA: lactonase family protein [Terriglobia bacterium]|nr:lactonase family protein [Terriglobia bacterium]
MPAHNHRRAAKAHQPTSRREFLKSSAALAGAVPVLASSSQEPASATKGPILAYAGTYSNPLGPEGSPGRGEGIYLLEMNPATGALKVRDLFRNDQNPSWVALDASRTHLYSVNETGTYMGANSGSVSSYSIDRASGRLTLLNTVSSEGAGTCHLSVHPSGKYVLVANYDGGTFAVLPVRSDGSLGAASDVKHQVGLPGPQNASSGPRGNFAISGHDAPHAHMIDAEPSGRFVIGADLGTDRLMIWKLDLEKGTLIPNDPASVALPPGDGPRHFVFHPKGRWMYSLQEEASTLVGFDFDAQAGKLTAQQTLSSLPEGFAGTNFTSEVRVSSDGRFVYAANHLHDSIAIFSVAETGKLAYVGAEWTRGDYPRSITLDPTGNFLYSCNQRADAITVFRIERKTGKLTFTGEYVAVGTPAILVFLT